MQDRFLGHLETASWASLGASLAELTSTRRHIPLSRMRARLQRRRGAALRWHEIATRARETVQLHASTLFPISSQFLEGAAQAGGAEMWELFTLYEIESEHLLERPANRVEETYMTSQKAKEEPNENAANIDAPKTSYYYTSALACNDDSVPAIQRRWKRGENTSAAPRELAGCTGIACSSGIVGQSEEVDPRVYDYGAQDAVFDMRIVGDTKPALLYDPACTFCPIGIGIEDLCVTRFSLFPKITCGEYGCIPLVVVLWELLLGCHSLERSLEFLRRLFSTNDLPVPMASGASLMLSQCGHGVVVVEWSASQLWLRPVMGEGALVVRANHCLDESDLSDDEAVQDMMDESRLRQHEVQEFIAQQLCSGQLPPLTLEQAQQALSQSRVQNDSVLATVVICPKNRSLHVRFRIQTKEMCLVEQTVQRDLWHHFYTSDEGRRRARWSKNK